MSYSSAGKGSSSLLRWNEVPDEFVECFITSGYRKLHGSTRECLISVFQPTNETFNFWTHFVPLLILLKSFCHLLFLETEQPFHHPTFLPLWCYAFGVTLTLLMSCIAHLFNCMSVRLRRAFFYLDYALISFYSFCSTLAYRYYVFPKLSVMDVNSMDTYFQGRSWYRTLISLYTCALLPAAFTFAILCTILCCTSRSRCYPFATRIFAFVMPLSLTAPVVAESIIFDLKVKNPTLFVCFYRRFLWLVLAAFFYLSKVPERLKPGCFDIMGHSHQFFHIFTFLGIYDQLSYVRHGLHQYVQSPKDMPTFTNTIGLTLLLLGCLIFVTKSLIKGTSSCKKD
ncbi:membrane progestin receptor epsilon [Protopterus annectens]|uniref:membrane progestin receptor epsilon n=1 Tax=Protopterus annectens TaxID=7888 RepID=UPI001CF983F0|nr:membrane progestin receptor epsilon [Protopterus annectens]